MSKYLLVLFLISNSILVSCKKENPKVDLSISTISLNVEDNGHLITKNFIAKSIHNEFELELPSELKNKSATIQVKHNAESLRIDDKITQSESISVTLIDKVNIELINKDGVTKKITLNIKFNDSNTLLITNIQLLKNLNPSLDKDYTLQTKENDYAIEINNTASRNLILSIQSNAKEIFVNNIKQVNNETVNDFSQVVTYTLISENGIINKIDIKIAWTSESLIVPHIHIVTENSTEITSKETYLSANLQIDGLGKYPNFSGRTEIRGRGNSTWSMPKKPYRIRLLENNGSREAEILGLPKARNWVLLANYIDPTLMCNTVAMKIGKDLEVPFTHDMIPVDLTINGVYRGSYILTQQVEEHENRVNIGSNGVLLELDTYYDENYKFRSSYYNLPVMVKEPDLNNTEELTPIRTEFQQLEDMIYSSSFPNNNYKNLFDVDVFVRYIMVYFLTGNEEFNHPKSIYIHKKAGEKYAFGPLWDFDWAYGYESNQGHFTGATRNLFWTNNNIGSRFFQRLFEDPIIKSAFKTHWQNYRNQKLPLLYTFIDNYANGIRTSQAKDHQVWGRGNNFDSNISKMKTYLQNRTIFIDSFVQNF